MRSKYGHIFVQMTNALISISTNLGPDLEATLRAIRSGKVTDEEVGKLMSVFETTGTNIRFLHRI